MTNDVVVLPQNFAAQYDGVKAPDPGPGPMVIIIQYLSLKRASFCITIYL